MLTDIETILCYIIILDLLLESDLTDSEIEERFDEIVDWENTGFDMAARYFLDELYRNKSVAEVCVLNPEKSEAKSCYRITESGKKKYALYVKNYLFIKGAIDEVFNRFIKYRNVI